MRREWDVSSDRKLRSAVSTLVEFANQSYYRRWLGAGSMSLFNTGGTEQATTRTSDFPHLSLAQSSTDDILIALPRPELWIDGDLLATIFYTGSGAANLAAVDMSLRYWTEGSAVASRTTLSKTDLTVPNSNLASAQFGPWNLTAAANMFSLAIERASDSHAAALDIVGMFLDFKPRRY